MGRNPFPVYAPTGGQREKSITSRDVPAPYVLRVARPDDARGIVELLTACDLADMGETEGYSPYDIADEIERADGQTRAYVVMSPENALVAYGLAGNEGSGELFIDNFVHPAHRGQGLGTALVRWTEHQARDYIIQAPAGARVTLLTGVLCDDDAARAVMSGEGYELARIHWKMRIDLTELPAAPTWPAGITVRTFQPGRDERATFECVEEAFSDHWGHVPRDFATWI